MTNETKHTPAPWFSGEVSRTYDDGIEYINISAGDGCHVCKVSSREFEEGGSQNKANADHIVKCVNLHDELVEALLPIANIEIILDKPDDEDICFVSYGTIKKIKETLKKAGAL